MPLAIRDADVHHVRRHAPLHGLRRRLPPHHGRARQGDPRGEAGQGDAALLGGDSGDQERPRREDGPDCRLEEQGGRAADPHRVPATTQGQGHQGQTQSAHRQVHARAGGGEEPLRHPHYREERYGDGVRGADQEHGGKTRGVLPANRGPVPAEDHGRGGAVPAADGGEGASQRAVGRAKLAARRIARAPCARADRRVRVQAPGGATGAAAGQG
mmetsp:Transcript_31356/g.74514  ORF Transcript_31356/g.74514 Transcript_31356/m.74514 type:complete len:214 (-) Transcript_31356:1277-1918(-)